MGVRSRENRTKFITILLLTITLIISTFAAAAIEDDDSGNNANLSDPPLNGDKEAQSSFSKWNNGYRFRGNQNNAAGVFQNATSFNPGASGASAIHTVAFEMHEISGQHVIWSYSNDLALELRVENGELEIIGAGAQISIENVGRNIEYGVAVRTTQGGNYEAWFHNATNGTTFKPTDGGSCCNSNSGTLTVGGREDTNTGELNRGGNVSIYELRRFSGNAIGDGKIRKIINSTDSTYALKAEGNETRLYLMEKFTQDPLNTATFDNVGEVRTDNSFLDPKVWVNDHGDVLNDEAMDLHRYDQNLTNEISLIPCSQHSQMTSSNPTSLFGLAVTVDNRPMYVCQRTHGGNVLVMANTFGEVDTWINTDCNGYSEIIEARTGNAVWTINNAFTCYDFNDMLLPRTLGFTDDVNDISMSLGNETWMAATGPDGTNVRANNTGSKVIPTEGIQGDSIAIYDTRLWIAFADTDTVTRYDILEGNDLNANKSATIDTDDIHSIRLSKDGNYLLTRNDGQVQLWGANNLTNLRTFTVADSVSMDMDALNNYVYVATNTQVQQFEVFNVTFSVAGGGNETNGSGLNPAPDSEPFADEETTDPFADDDNTTGGLDEGPVSNDAFNLSGAAQSVFGGNETAAGLFFAALMIMGFAMLGAMLVKDVANSGKGIAVGSSIGASAGFLTSFAFGWIPTALIIFIFMVALAVVLLKFRAGGE